MFLLITVILTFTAHVNSGPAISYIKSGSEESLLNYIIKESSSEDNKKNCYNYYKDVFDEILKIYDEEYSKCKEVKKQKLDNLDKEGKKMRNQTTESIKEVCNNLRNCTDISNDLSFFECVDKKGDWNVGQVWGFSQASKSAIDYYKATIGEIFSQAIACFHLSHQNFVISNANATRNMENCFKYGLNESTTSKPVITSPTTITTDVPTEVATSTEVTTQQSTSEENSSTETEQNSSTASTVLPTDILSSTEVTTQQSTSEENSSTETEQNSSTASTVLQTDILSSTEVTTQQSTTEENSTIETEEDPVEELKYSKNYLRSQIGTFMKLHT